MLGNIINCIYLKCVGTVDKAGIYCRKINIIENLLPAMNNTCAVNTTVKLFIPLHKADKAHLGSEFGLI